MKRLLVFLLLALVAAHAVAMTASPQAARPQAPQEMSRVVPAPYSAGVGSSADHP